MSLLSPISYKKYVFRKLQICLVSFLPFEDELRNMLIISHSKYLMTTSYEHVSGLGALRTKMTRTHFSPKNKVASGPDKTHTLWIILYNRM